MGATPQQLDEARQALRQRAQSEVLPVWPEHWRALEVFVAMGSQWRVVLAAKGLHHLGLDYASLPAVLAELRASPDALADVAPWPDGRTLLAQLRTLEHAACASMAAR